MATLSDIRNRIKRDLTITSTVYDTQIDDCTRSAIRTYSGRPMWFLQKTDTVTLPASASSVALPSDFASLRFCRLYNSTSVGSYAAGGTGFDFVSDFGRFRKDYCSVLGSANAPTKYSIDGGYIYVNATYTTDQTIEVNYYKKDITLPASDGDTSVWLGDDGGVDAIRTLAMAMVKDECQAYEGNAVGADWARAESYYKALQKRNIYVLGGR